MLRATTLLLLLLASACADVHERATWSDVDDAAMPSASSEAGTRAQTAAADQAPDLVRATPGVLIDRALAHFTGERSRSRRADDALAYAQAWDLVLLEIGAACEEPPRASDLGGFVRARVTLEVELERDQERGVPLPADLDKRVTAVLSAVDESVGELRAANAPGTALASSARLGDGELTLRAPLSPMTVNSPFGVRTDPINLQKRFHSGVDLGGHLGDTVFAAAAGLVVYAGLQGGYGKQVVLDHGDGVRTHYSHLSQILVQTGQTVTEGEGIALVGSTGRSTGPHLHFAVTNGEDFLDPLAVLDIPFSAIATQVKTGTEKEKRAFALENKGDTVEIHPLGAVGHD